MFSTLDSLKLSQESPGFVCLLSIALCELTYRSDPWALLADVRLAPRAPSDPKHTFSRRILSEIQSIERVLQQAKELFNDNIPITSALPSEILAEIFCHVRDGSEYNMDKPSWISVSYVCRRWRTVALFSPEVWTRLDSNTLPYTVWNSVLSRTGVMPLYVTLGGEEKDILFTEFVSTTNWDQYSRRVDTLALYHDMDPTTYELRRFFESPLISLKHLTACIWFRHRSQQPTFLNIPPDITFPELTSLHIVFSPFPWDHSVYTSLKSLTLDFPKKFAHLFPDATELALLFGRMTRLEDVSFLGDLVMRGASNTTRIAPPPSLKTLRTNSILLPGYIAARPSLTLSIVYLVYHKSDILIEAVDRLFILHAGSKSHLLPTAYALRRKLLPTAASHIAFENIQLWRGPRDADPDTYPPFIDISCETWTPDDWALLPTSAHLDEVAEARINIDKGTSIPTLRHLLLRSPQLHTLRLQGQSLAHFIPAIMLAGPRPSAGFLPQLRTIVVHDVADEDRAAALEAFALLIVWLELRNERGTPVREVHITQSLAGAENLQDRLERVVAVVQLV
jgi:hypothetical protein